MLVFAAFLSICVAAVLFLLRFLVALDSEGRSAQTASFDPIYAQRIQPGISVPDSAPVLTLVRFDSSPDAERPRPVFSATFAVREKSSRFKEA